MSGLFRIVAAAVFVLVLCGCQSQPEGPSADRISVINALTGEGEPDVLLAVTDNRSGKTTYAKTDADGNVRIDIPEHGWEKLNSKRFKLELAKRGFDAPTPCDQPLPAGKEARMTYCIAPAGTDRAQLNDHNHAPLPGAKPSQAALREEWEALKQPLPQPK